MRYKCTSGRVGSGRQFRVHDGSGRVSCTTGRVVSGPEKSDLWSTLDERGRNTRARGDEKQKERGGQNKEKTGEGRKRERE